MRRFAQVGAPPPLAEFSGLWHLSRQITQADGTTAAFDGTAVWKWQDGASEPTLEYRETGHLKLAGQPPMQAERRYLWRSGPTVWFTDGRFFHMVPPGGGSAHHQCDPDSYTATYDFSGWTRPEGAVFSTRWEVTGPRKAYHMDTIYRKS